MALSAILVILYLLATTLVGALAARGGLGWTGGPDSDSPGRRREYVLGGSKAGPLLLFATMAATNFSAFTVFGLSGAGYRLGWAYYPAMGFGTGLMAVSFLLLGIPLRRLAAERGYVSPADFVRDRYGSPALAKAFSGVLVLVTLPYLATQAIAGGRMLETLMGLPYPLASFLLVAVTAFYTFRGGFKAVAWTDLLQLVVLVAGAGMAFAAVLGLAGGLPAAAARLAAVSPAHLARGGAGAGVDLGALLGLWLLWALADPLFPQLFQRFYTAKDDASLKRAAMLYPLVCGGLFFLTVGVGVVGAALLPGLVGKETEQVFSRLALAAGSPAAGAVFALAAVAALMSTMDSQLLTLSSMIVEDFLPKRLKARRLDSLFVALLALAAWLISLAPPALILDWLTGAAFPAYAALAPIVWVGLYGRKTGAAAIAASCALGLLLVVLEAAKLLSFGPLPAVAVNFAAECLVLIAFRAAGAFARRAGAKAAPAPANTAASEAATGGIPRLSEAAEPRWLLAFLLLGAFGTGFWHYGKAPTILFGAPAWVWGSLLSCVLLSGLYAAWKPRTPGSLSARPRESRRTRRS